MIDFIFQESGIDKETISVFLTEATGRSAFGNYRESENIHIETKDGTTRIHCTMKNADNALEMQGAQLISLIKKIEGENFSVFSDGDTRKIRRIINGMILSSFHFDKYKIPCINGGSSKKIYIGENFESIKDDSFLNANKLCRHLIAEPSNILTPENFSERIVQNFKAVPSVKIRLLRKKEILAERMEALYGVAKGSDKEPYVVCIEYFGAAKNEKPVLLVGKGVTFDAGGISMKTEADMEIFPMKIDMAGAASVYASVFSAASMNLKLNVVGILGLVENMPSGTAQKPSDIVRSRSGKTIEIMTTDCEGRLVLADLIDYGAECYNPSEIVDVATLEIGTMHALHDVYAGLFSNNEALSKKLIRAGEESCEPLWPLPLNDFYNDLIISDVADLKNRNGQTVFASGSTGAHFIGNFIPKDIPWAHIDIAGVTLRSRAVSAVGSGVSGFGGRLLAEYLYQSSLA